MTVKQVADALGVSERTIQKHSQNLGFTKNGKKTLLTEYQCKAIKERIGKQNLALSCKVENAVTEIERKETIAKAILYLQEDLQNALQRAEIAEEKVNTLQIELDQNKEWYSIKRMEKLNPNHQFRFGLLKAESKRLGVEVRKVFDQNYGEVNSYHISVWQSLYFDTINY